MDAVWREIYGLINLIYLLPADLWYGPADPQAISCMTRDTVELDWSRFLVHARRVRELNFSPLGSDRLSRRPPWNAEIFDGDTVLRHLHRQCPASYMLPTLLTLFWGVEVENIHMFLCLSLRSLHLRSSTAYHGMIELVEAQAPIVTSLDICSVLRTPTDTEVDAISLSILRMNRLRSFHCDFITRSKVLVHLSNLPALQSLFIPLDSVDDPTFSPAPFSASFPSLTNLIVRPSEPTLLCSLLNGISSPHLDRVWWEANDTDPNDVLEVVTVFTQHCSRDALNSVTLSAPWELMFGALFDRHSVTLHTLNPLLALNNLTELHLAIPWLDLGNEDLEQIASHLPLLTNLYLSPPGLLYQSRITLQGLLPLFRH
ncbi:hypothetical protein B0H19DRAFT_1109215 [Mycena capillaripes]|nr:hypothetical protein B0H19DRAFT_1109215 [Mycena capillaripes]